MRTVQRGYPCVQVRDAPLGPGTPRLDAKKLRHTPRGAAVQCHARNCQEPNARFHVALFLVDAKFARSYSVPQVDSLGIPTHWLRLLLPQCSEQVGYLRRFLQRLAQPQRRAMGLAA